MAAIAGDRSEFDRRFEAFVRISDQMRQPRELVFRTWAEASRAHFDGRLADAERLTIEGMTAAPAADVREEQVSAFLGGLFYAIRIAQGRLDELVDTVIEPRGYRSRARRCGAWRSRARSSRPTGSKRPRLPTCGSRPTTAPTSRTTSCTGRRCAVWHA